ncbi:MAG: tetratricopeptide repeat protein [Syntrophobacteraceae bacterium]
MSKTKGKKRAKGEDWSRFQAEAEYADSIFKSAIGDIEGSIASLERACELMPTYAPAVLSMGSVEYQRGRKAKGKKLFLDLLALPPDTEDLHEIIDEAGTFLIQTREYADGFDLYTEALARYPDVAVFHQGLGCCAGHQGLHEVAVQASRRALELEPGNQQFVNDLGWSLLEAGNLVEARSALERAVAMNPTDQLASENLRYCMEQIKKHGKASSTKTDRAASKPSSG